MKQIILIIYLFGDVPQTNLKKINMMHVKIRNKLTNGQ